MQRLSRQDIRHILGIAPLPTDLSVYDTSRRKNQSSSPRPTMKVIINLEASGDFLMNASHVLAATGMTLEELFEFLATVVSAIREDNFAPYLLVNGRLPDHEGVSINSLVSSMAEQLETGALFYTGDKGTFKLLSVDRLDDSALIEVEPGESSRNGTTTAHPVPISRNKRAARGAIRVTQGGRVISDKRSDLE